MAKDKKSFVLYSDLIRSIEHLTNEEKGILFNHLLEYVNDLNPILKDRLILTAWKPIELQLKRDLIKFEEVKLKRSNAGKRSAELKAKKNSDNIQQNSTNSTSVDFVQQTSTNSTVNDNVNVNVNDINIYISEKEFLEIWKRARFFYDKKPCGIENLQPFEKQLFKQLLDSGFKKQDFEFAVAGLFFQDTLPAVRIRPDWILKAENFEKMLDCWKNKSKIFENKKFEIKNQKFKTGDI